MLDYMVNFFISWFTEPNILGIGLAIAFGAVWLAGYWPPLFKKPWLWAVIVASAFLSLVAVSFIQIPLQILVGQALGNFWSQETIMQWVLLAGIPQILLSGLVQEGSKMVPMVVWWWRSGRKIDPKWGLIIGAAAGAGFGIFEAVWAHKLIFASGWSWELVQTSGLMALAGFWERFFTVAFHIAISALVGYGLAKGWGWQCYLLAAFLHSLLNYSAVLLTAGVLTAVSLEILVAVAVVIFTGVILWFRWRKPASADRNPSGEEAPVTEQ
ncbi:YhfC family glutamic-type intramembrane protease [Chloroflexota bacterium]